MSRADGQTYFIILFLLSVLLHLIFPIRTIVVPPVTYAGLLLIGAGLVLCIRCRSLFIKNLTTMSPFETPSRLLTEGPFGMSRNPVYLGMALILAGLAVFLGTLVTFTMPVMYIIVMEILFIPAEERVLEKEFGEQYRNYRRSVRRWI